jgi:hypothetical protein
MNREAQTEHSGQIGREWRRAEELENSELSLIPKDREGGEGSAKGKREERETRGRTTELTDNSIPSQKPLDRPVGMLRERTSQ